MPGQVIALLTDFGEDDFFTASLKGVILETNPSARIVDISHRVPPFDIRAAGFILSACAPFFPFRTVFLTVVDPGVGSSRRILAAECEGRFYVAPDNGVLSRVLAAGEAVRVHSVMEEKYFLPGGSKTFEGRDKMAPVAARLVGALSVGDLGPEIRDWTRIPDSRPEASGGTIRGQVLYVDRFGNCITDIPAGLLETQVEKLGSKSISLTLRGRKVRDFLPCYDVQEKGQPLFLVGSLGLVEVAVCRGSAAQLFGARPGDEVSMEFDR